MNARTVWVFVGSGARLPSGVFSSRDLAEEWIRTNRLAGLLTEYPLDQSAYDWAVENGHFRPSKPEHGTPKFVAGFTSAMLPHFHYETDEPGGT